MTLPIYSRTFLFHLKQNMRPVIYNYGFISERKILRDSFIEHLFHSTWVLLAWTQSNMKPKSHNTISLDSLFLFNVNYKIESWPHGSEVTNLSHKFKFKNYKLSMYFIIWILVWVKKNKEIKFWGRKKKFPYIMISYDIRV